MNTNLPLIRAKQYKTPALSNRPSTADQQSFQQLRVDQLNVDFSYQRRPRLPHVNKIAKDFDNLLFGVVTVSQRRDGSFWILDGQHRVAALLKLGKGAGSIPCEVLTGLTHTQEAAIFYVRNSATQPMSAADKFRGRLEAQDPVALELLEIVQASGFRLNLESSELSDGRICGVGTLSNVYANYRSGHLEDTLALIGSTWGLDNGPHGTTIGGVSVFISFYRDAYSRSRFVSQLSRVSTNRIRDESTTYRKATGVSADKAICAMLVRFYNARLTAANQLPSLEEQRAINMIREAKGGK